MGTRGGERGSALGGVRNRGGLASRVKRWLKKGAGGQAMSGAMSAQLSALPTQALSSAPRPLANSPPSQAPCGAAQSSAREHTANRASLFRGQKDATISPPPEAIPRNSARPAVDGVCDWCGKQRNNKTTAGRMIF